MNAPAAVFDVLAIREDFPCLRQEVHGHALAYLDNAATGQMPRQALGVLNRFHMRDRANVHRGVHSLSQRATLAYEAVRADVARFLGVGSEREIVLTTGTTESINLVAATWGRTNLGPGDAVVISAMEHHSNIVPWQMVCEETGAELRALRLTDTGELALDDLDALLEGAKLLALVHVSNALGTVNPVREIAARAHEKGVLVLLDGAQAVPHFPVDVAELGCDFYAFSAHKMFGPTGVGVLWGRGELLERMPPYRGGGDMIRTVGLKKSTWAAVPAKFEAGTPNIGGVIAMGASIAYLNGLDRVAAQAHEDALLAHASEALAVIPGVRLIGTSPNKVGVCAFVMDCAHPHDIGTVLDQEGVAVRTGHHCTQPLMEHFGVPATARASFAFYNTHEEVEQLIRAVHRVRELFA